jgi:hypothetical protein
MIIAVLVCLALLGGCDGRLLRGPVSSLSPEAAVLTVDGAASGAIRSLLKQAKEEYAGDLYRDLPSPRKVQTISPTGRSGTASYSYASSMPATKMNSPIMDGWLAAGSGGGGVRAASYASAYAYGNYRGL